MFMCYEVATIYAVLLLLHCTWVEPAMLKTSSLCSVRVTSLPRRSAARAFHAATWSGNRSGTCMRISGGVQP